MLTHAEKSIRNCKVAWKIKALHRKEKSKKEEDQEIIKKIDKRITKVLLEESVELSNDFAQIIEESDETIEEYKNNNDNLWQKA